MQQKYHCNRCPEIFQHQSDLISHFVHHQISDSPTNSSEPPLAVMAQKQPISNNSGHSAPMDEDPANFKSPGVFSVQKKYFCEYCSKSFSRSGHLEMHRRTHTGERPFVCQYCSRAFTQSSALYRHHKTCVKSPNKGNNEQLSKNVSMLEVSTATAKQQATMFSASGDSLSTCLVDSAFQEKDDSSDDDDIMFLCCDHTFTSSTDYDKHVRTHHPKSHTEFSLSLTPHGNSERGIQPVTAVHLASNSYEQHVTDNACFDLSHALGQGNNARVKDKESGVVYLVDNSNNQDTVTINLSEHSVNGGSGTHENISISDECSNSGMRQVTSKLTGSSNDLMKDDDEDVFIEATSIAIEQNNDGMSLDDDIFILENESPEKTQISQIASSKKQNQKCSEYSMPLFDVASKFGYNDASQHQKSLSNSFYIRNLSNSLSFKKSIPDGIKKNSKVTSNLQKLVGLTEENAGVENPSGQSASSHSRLKSSRLQSCQFCSRQFTRTSHLTQHLRTHTGERPFRCEYCGNAFTQTSALNRHLKTCNVAQSVNSSVAGNATSLHQPSALSVNSNFDANNDVGFSYEHSEEVFQQSPSLDTHLKVHKDNIDAKVAIKNPLPKGNSLSLSDSSNSTADVHYSANFFTLSSKHKSRLTKMTVRSGKDQALRPKKKRLLQKFVKCERMLRCDVCFLEFVSRKHLAAHARKHLQSNSVSSKTLQSSNRNLLPSTLAWTLSSKNKHLFRNKVYNTLKYKRNFEKQKSFTVATNSQSRKTYSLLEKSAKKSSNHSKGAKSEACRTNQQHHSKIGRVMNSEKNLKLSEESTRDSVVTGANKNPQNSFLLSDLTHATDSHQSNRISSHVYTCDICAKSFYSDLLFNIHRSTHSLRAKKKNNPPSTSAKKKTPSSFYSSQTSEADTSSFQDKVRKTFLCIYCHKTFLRHSHLETHVRTHTGEKPFHCESCGRAFSQSSARNRHIKTCFMARQIMSSELESAESLLTSNHPETTVAVKKATRKQDEAANNITFTCCDQSFNTSIDLNAHILNHKSSKYPHSEETFHEIAPLSFHLQHAVELQNRKVGGTYGNQTTTCISGSPIKCEENTDSDLNIYRAEQQLVNNIAISTDKFQIKNGKPHRPAAKNNEMDDPESKIFDSALQVVHESLQMRSGGSLQQANSSKMNELSISEPDPESLEAVRSQNCPNTSDICPSLSDIPQPNVSLSLGSEFVDIMDTDLSSISNTIPCGQEEESSALQKDIFPEYSPETPPFVSECLLPKSSAEIDDPLEEEVCKSSGSGTFKPSTNLNEPDKNYTCDYCGKIFSQSEHLNSHVRIHMSDRFFCPSCSAVFMQASALSRHFKVCTQVDGTDKGSLSKNDLDTQGTVDMSQDFQISETEVPSNTGDTYESIRTYKLPVCSSLEATMDINDNSNNFQEPLEHWTLTSFSNSEIVKSEDIEDSVYTKNRKETVVNTDNPVNVKINGSDSLKKLTKCTSDDQEKEIPIETDSQALTGDFICSYCDRHFASPHHLDEHVSCHSVKKAYVCWFCKETYALSSDFEQHLKICGAPATFPNLSSPNTSKRGSDDEDSKFVDIALFTPLTASANLSDCDEGGGVGGETDIPCTEDQAKDKSNLARVSQCLQLESLVDNVPNKPEGILKEKKLDIVKSFESVEFLSRQMQDNSSGESGSNSDTGSKFTESLANNVIGQEKNNTINDCLKIACNNNSTIQNDICDRVMLNQSKRDVDLEESFVKVVDNAKDDASKKNLISEGTSKQLSSQLPEFIISSTDCLKAQSSPEDSTNSVVFICCQQTYAEVQDYNQHLLNCHPEYTDKKLRQQIQSSPETLKEGLILNQDTSPVSKQLDVSDNPLLPLNAGDQRRYVCHYCTRGFTRSGHLNQHMRTHTGERPYPCQFCSKAFTQSSALNRHLKTCNKAKLFYNDELKIMKTNYSVILSEFQQTLDGNRNNSSNNVAPSLNRSLDNKKHDSVSSGNDLLQHSHLNFNSIDKIPCDETNEGITKCEHCGHKCLKLDEFTEHRKTCPSNSTIYMSRPYHQENDSPGKGVDNEVYNNSIQHRVLMEDIDKEEQPSNIEIKKEVLDVIFECEFCHELFADELKLAQHRESHCVQNEEQEWNMDANFENGEMRKTIKDEETCTFTCCGQMFLGLESYNFHMENHHSFEDRDGYVEMNQPDSKMQERQSKNMCVKNETGSFGHVTDRYLNSSPERRQLISLSKSKHDDNIGKKVSDELSGLSSVDRSTALDNISRFQVLEFVKEISHPETSISSQGIAVSDIENPKSDSNSPMTSKELRGMALAALSSNETSLSNDTNLNWLQWENYITGQLITSSSSTSTTTTAVMSSRDKRYSCDYCDKKFTRSGHLVMHRRTHTGERPFSCRHCHKAFTQSSALNRHLKTCNLARLAVAENLETQSSASATEEGIQLSCCGKNFHWTRALNVHQVIHNIYKCHCCNQKFENFELLLMHIKSHDREQLPVSILSGQSTDNHCNYCPASFQSVIEQLIHMKTEHGGGATEGLSAHNHISSKFQKQSFLSSKIEYLNRGKCSKDSNVFSTKKSSNSSSSISSQQKNYSNRPNIRKISRFRRLLSLSNFRMPSKSNTFSKHRQNKQEIYPASTLLRRRYSSLFSDQRSVGTPEFTQSNMSVRSHNVRRAIKRAVNNIGKHRPFSEQFAPSLDAQMLPQADQQRATKSVGTVKHLDQAEQDNNRTLMKILLNNKNNQVNSKSIIKKEVIENKTYGRRKKKFPNSQQVRDQDIGYLPESRFDNDLQPDDPPCQAAASLAKCLKEEKSNIQPRKQLSHSGVQKHPNLKTRPNNLLHLKRSLSSELGSLGTEGNSLSNKAVHSSSKYNLKSSKYKKGAGLPMVVDQTSSQFICTICKKGFTCSSHLKIHYRTHTEEWPYTCTSCNRCFMQVSTLNSHRKTCPYRKSVNANLAPSSNSIPPNPGTSVVSDGERNTPLSVGDEESVSLTSCQSHWGKANVENSRAVVTNEHDKLLASFSPPSNPDKELSIMIKTPSEGLNLQETKRIIADSSDILSDERLGPEKASPYTEVKFLLQKETATSSDNFNESQHQLEISKESFQGCKDCRQNSKPSCPHQQKHTPSSFSKYIIKIEPGSEAVNSCSASKEPFQLYDSFESASNKSSSLSQENLKDYLSNNDLNRSKEQTDLTSFSLPQSANSQINDDAKSEPSCGQLGARQSEDSTLPASHGKSEDSHNCKNCGLTFHQLTSLIQHNCPRKVNRYPFSCEYCDKSFTRHSHLVTHRRTHTGERPYQCRYCQRSFTQTSALYRHQKTCSFIPAHLKATPVKSSKS